MKIKNGYSFYGQEIGVLTFKNIEPRVPGDAGHAASFPYPVRFEVLEGSFAKLLKPDETMRQNIINACLKLKAEGIKGIVSNCGMMSLYQDSIGAEIGIPFVGSALCQIPFIWQLIGKSGSIGILTGHSGLLSESHLKASGWNEDIKLSIQGLQNESHFADIVINGGLDLDIVQMDKDILHGATLLKEKTPDLRAIIIECSNLSTYSKHVAEELEIPVFDTLSAADMLARAINPPSYI